MRRFTAIILVVCLIGLTCGNEEDDVPDQCDALWDDFDKGEKDGDVTKSTTVASTAPGATQTEPEDREDETEQSQGLEDQEEAQEQDGQEENTKTSNKPQKKTTHTTTKPTGARGTERPKESAGDPYAAEAKAREHVENLSKETGLDKIEDDYLRPSLDNELQRSLRNPLIDLMQSSRTGDTAKVERCLGDMNKDVKKYVDESKERFNGCKRGKKGSHTCMVENEPLFSSKIKQLFSTVQSCITSGN